MNRALPLTIVILLSLLLFITACDESGVSTTLSLRLISSESERYSSNPVISPQEEGLIITSYIISGTGPNDKTFNVTSSSSQVDINGLVIGTWTIQVTGLNQQGTPLAQGECTHHLTTRNNSVELPLNKFIGSGYVNIGFVWGDANYPELEFELKLTAQNKQQQTVTEGLNIYTTTATYATSLESGSYDLSFSLFSSNIRIAGGVVALRILDGKTSQDEITLVIDKITPEATGLIIANSVSDPVVGSIGGVDTTVVPYEPLVATYTHTEGGGSLETTVAWYLDGNHVGDGSSVEFTASSGPHRLDAVARTEKLGSVGVATHLFRASVSSRQGNPVVVTDIAQGDKDPFGSSYRLSNLGAATFLRDGRLLTVNHEGFQLSDIIQDQIIVVKNFDYPTASVSSIVVDTAENFVITTAATAGTVTLYKYDSESKSLSLIESITKNDGKWSGPILDVAIDPGTNRISLIEVATKKVYTSFYNSLGFETFKAVGSSLSGVPTHISQSSDGVHLVISNRDSNKSVVLYEHGISMVSGNPTLTMKAYTASNVSENHLQPSWYFQNHLYVALEDGLYFYLYPQATLPLPVTQKVTESNHLIVDLQLTSDQSRGWALSSSTNSKLFTYDFINGVPLGSGKTMEINGFKATSMAYSPKGNFLSVYNSNRLMLLRITDD